MAEGHDDEATGGWPLPAAGSHVTARPPLTGRLTNSRCFIAFPSEGRSTLDFITDSSIFLTSGEFGKESPRKLRSAYGPTSAVRDPRFDLSVVGAMHISLWDAGRQIPSRRVVLPRAARRLPPPAAGAFFSLPELSLNGGA